MVRLPPPRNRRHEIAVEARKRNRAGGVPGNVGREGDPQEGAPGGGAEESADASRSSEWAGRIELKSAGSP